MSPRTGSEAPPRPGRGRRWLRIALLVLAAVVALAVGAFVVWGLTPLQPTPNALEALESGNGVTVTQVDGGWTFVPSADSTRTVAGLVIYPGGHVDARAYAPYARAVAEQGFPTAIARVPLSLAFFDVNAADDLIAEPQFDGVARWAVGGHSLGGVAAARYASANRDRIGGLVLLASYPDSSADLSDSRIIVADVTGSVDTVLSWDNWEAAKPLLPQQTSFTSIEGGNHAQFGDYGEQPGDSPALISAEEQRAQATSATVEMLTAVAKGR